MPGYLMPAGIPLVGGSLSVTTGAIDSGLVPTLSFMVKRTRLRELVFHGRDLPCVTSDGSGRVRIFCTDYIRCDFCCAKNVS